MTSGSQGKAPPRKKKSEPKPRSDPLPATDPKGKPRLPRGQRKANQASPVQRQKNQQEMIPGFHTYNGLWYLNSTGISPKQIAHALKHVGSS